eukprot:Polyplicarium_translucidae@DN3258_c0_g1_i1.p3
MRRVAVCIACGVGVILTAVGRGFLRPPPEAVAFQPPPAEWAPLPPKRPWEGLSHDGVMALKGCPIRDAMYDRIDREIDVLAFASNHSSPGPWELATLYLKKDVALVKVVNGTVTVSLQTIMPHWMGQQLQHMLAFMGFADFVPDMKFVVNLLDEPRVARNNCFHDAYERGDPFLLRNCEDTEGLHGKRLNTTTFMSDSCKEVTAEHKDSHGFFVSASTASFTRPSHPIPIFSVSKVEGCFDDILVPWTYHYRAPRFRWLPPWSKKWDIVLWRGSTTGVESISNNATRASHRFRLVDFSAAANNEDPPFLDIKFSGKSQCRAPMCHGLQMERPLQFRRFFDAKYNVAIDGNSASMSEFFLFKGNSVVLRDSIFSSYYTDWFEEGQDYFSVKPDLSDFLEVLRGVVSSEAAAAEAARMRARAARSLLSRHRMGCYWLKALLAYAAAFPSALL